jgi:hypothetical protein
MLDQAAASKAIVEAAYGEHALALLGGHRILAYRIEGDYQGSVQVLAENETGEGFYRYLLIVWDWGSCEVCDEWQRLSPEEISQEMRKVAATFEDEEQLIAFLGGAPAYEALRSYRPEGTS